MNLMEAVQSVLSQYFGFRGRARRSEYWFWILATILFGIFAALIDMALGISFARPGPVSSLLNLLLFIPGLAVSFRRLHDIGKSGWWIGGFYLAIVIFVIVIFILALLVVAGGRDGEVETNLGYLVIIGVLGMMLYSIVLLIFFCQNSQVGPNNYGPNPKNEGNYDVFE